MMRSTKLTYWLALTLLAQVAAEPCFSLTWKDGKRAALSISYDDGFASQRYAASVLNDFGLHGTFYLTPTAVPDVIDHKQEWRQLFEQGHEIGNHSMRHPCADDSYPKERNLRLMTWQQVADEVNDAEGWIVKYIFNGELKDHTYAYPCGHTVIGPAASPKDPSSEMARRVGQCEYVAILSWNVRMARTVNGGPNDPNEVAARPYFIKGTAVSDSTAAIQGIEAAINSGGWTVLVFHQIIDGGDQYSTTPTEHMKVIEYVQRRMSDLWVDTVSAVGSYAIGNSPQKPQLDCSER